MKTDQSTPLSEVSDFDSFLFNLTRIHSEKNFKQANHSKYESLTKIELDVLTCIANDLSDLQISDKLKVKLSTINRQRKQIERKLATSSPNEIFKFALAFNLI